MRRFVGGRVEPAWVDDVTGDIVVRLLQRQDSLAEARDPLSWTYRVAANVIADHHRRRSVERRTLAQLGAEVRAPDPGADGGDHEATRRDLEACLLPFALELPSKYAEALLMTYFRGWSQVEAAERLGLSVSGMKSRVQRARAMLKRQLLDCCDFELDRRGAVIDMRPREARLDGGRGRSTAEGAGG
ncbi:MAG: sigma-70 family RNA polymerase sigma factor [Gemmatimonadota bacterium]|uniref:sigma-70 family RNA polymerase sigma factor n=1 Tax=Candidatus Palauibacter scopulicola TaxID=3056741 RepID=UPI00238B6AE6|nr:sigma-70 family RNA polymerase sigma factor [Candidatus Palauibacter scopulicola]MDE2661760.1 sigma-70 family RNA polymerase sigma factor [Candidatus Palauibacter scopulicola]